MYILGRGGPKMGSCFQPLPPSPPPSFALPGSSDSQGEMEFADVPQDFCSCERGTHQNQTNATGKSEIN